MARVNAETKMFQSGRIAQIGCFGLVVLLVLLVVIGISAVRSDLAKKREAANTVLARAREQVEKAPGVLGRMLAYGCGSAAEESVGNAAAKIDNLPDNATAAEIDAVWRDIEIDAWPSVNRGCAAYLSEPAFIDLTTEMEGIRNRYSVETGNFRDAAGVYNTALKAFPANLVNWGFDAL